MREASDTVYQKVERPRLAERRNVIITPNGETIYESISEMPFYRLEIELKKLKQKYKTGGIDIPIAERDADFQKLAAIEAALDERATLLKAQNVVKLY